MALIRSGLHEPETALPPDGRSSRELVVFGHQWAKQHGFELTDEVAGEIGFLYFHAGARTSKNRDADHLVQHAHERGHEIRRAPKAEPKAEPEEEVSPVDHESEDAKTRAGDVDGRGVTQEEFLRAHANSA